MRLRGSQVSALRQDLLAAERHAAVRVRQALAAGTPAMAMAMVVRAALMRSSIGTVGRGMPPLLLARAVQEGLIEPRAAWDAALALPQLDPESLNHKCAVLAALRVEGGIAAADDPRRALKVILQAVEQGKIQEVFVAWSLWDLVRGCGLHWLDPTEEVVTRLRTDDARGVGQRHLALLRMQAGQPERAEAAAVQVPLASGRGLLVGMMAADASAAALPALRRLHAALNAEERQVASPGVAVALWQLGQRGESLLLLSEPASSSEWVKAVQGLAATLDADAVRELLVVARRRAESDPACVAAQVALVLRYPADERETLLSALWQKWIMQAHGDRALVAQRVLIEALPAALWPAPLLARKLTLLSVVSNDKLRVLLAPELWLRGEQALVLDWLDRALPEERTALAGELVRALVPVVDAKEFGALTDRLDRLANRHAREVASVPLIGRLAQAGQGQVAWKRLGSLENAHFRDEALKGCAPHLRGSALEEAARALSRIGDAADADLLHSALNAALDSSGSGLVHAIDSGGLPQSHFASQLAGWLDMGQLTADEMVDRLRAVQVNEVLATALLTVDRVANGGVPLAVYEALLAIDQQSTLMRLAADATPRLALLTGEWAEPLKQRYRPVVERWFAEELKGYTDEVLAMASAWHAWCFGAPSTLERLANLRRTDNPFDHWFAAAAATLPFMVHTMRECWLVDLQDLIDAEPDPYRPLIRGGDLSQLDDGLLAAMKAALARAEFKNVRGEASELAVLGARVGDLDFAAMTARGLEEEGPNDAMKVYAALMRHDSDAGRRLQHALAAARCAQRLTNIINQASHRSDALAGLVPGFLNLETGSMAEVLLPLMGTLADAPRGEFMRDIAALAPALQRLDLAQGAKRIMTASADVQAWWP
jgi:hypothetical protein